MNHIKPLFASSVIGLFYFLHFFYFVEALKSSAVCKAPDEKLSPEKWVLYKGGVVEYAPFVRWTEGGGQRILEENADAFVSFAHLAKNQDVDILIYPEYGLTGLNLDRTKEELIKLSQKVPEALKGNVPCLQEPSQHTYPALMNLSCTARSLKMYLVVHVIEWVQNDMKTHSKVYFFSTHVVLNKKGEVEARYRKKNLLQAENPLTLGSEDPSTALFTADFGVTFTLQLGFDIMEEDPGMLNLISGSVMDVAMACVWKEGLPFHTAPQTFSGWARGLRINLLVANYHNPEEFGTGSGIFSGIEPYPMSNTYNKEASSRIIVKEILSKLSKDSKIQKRKNIPNIGLIVGKVHHGNPPLVIDSKHADNVEYRAEQVNVSLTKISHQNLINYTSISLVASSLKTRTSKTHCHGSFCCKATFSYREYSQESYSYHLIVYSGLDYKEGNIQIYVQKCAVTYCFEDDISTCAAIEGPLNSENGFRLHKLMGMFDTEFIFPSILKMNLILAPSEDWDFTKRLQGQWNASMVTKSKIKNLLSASLFARLYEKDSESR